MPDEHENAPPATAQGEEPNHANPREKGGEKLKEAARNIGLASNVVIDNLFDKD
jgi:hypothetical protein